MRHARTHADTCDSTYANTHEKEHAARRYRMGTTRLAMGKLAGLVMPLKGRIVYESEF